MEFTVHTANGLDRYENDARFSIENAVLTAYAGDGSRVLYAPTFWQRVTVAERAPGDASR
jgi:hypothetical protein